MVRVDDGGQFTVEGSTLARAGGSADPFPCDGDTSTKVCVSVHADAITVAGLAEVWTTAPLVCDVGTGACPALPCPPISLENAHISYSIGRIAPSSVATFECIDGFHSPTTWPAQRARTCQADGTWSGALFDTCMQCISNWCASQVNHWWESGSCHDAGGGHSCAIYVGSACSCQTSPCEVYDGHTGSGCNVVCLNPNC